MARPKTELPSAVAIRALADGQGRLALRVTPGARSAGMQIDNGLVLVKVRTKPQDGAANEAVLTMLAKALDIAPSQLELLRGAASRDKLVKIGG